MKIDGLVLGKYRIEKLINNGSFASVFQAKEELTNRMVAIKMLPKVAYPPGRMRYLLTELSAMGMNWGHPNIVSIHTVEPGDDEYVAYIVMEYVDGPSLRQLIAMKPPSTNLALNIAMDICCGLIAAHERNILHRDIKPQNILLTSDLTAKISDFGVARILEETNEYAETITGTRRYMAPEQYEGNYDYRADIYSTGLILYEMLIGKFPFRGKNVKEIQLKKQCTEIEFNDEQPDDLCEILKKALHRDVRARYQTATEMYDDLDQILKRRYASIVQQTMQNHSDPALQEATLSQYRAELRLSPETAERIELELSCKQRQESEKQKHRRLEAAANAHYEQAIQHMRLNQPQQALQEMQQAHRLYLSEVSATKKADWVFRQLLNLGDASTAPSTAQEIIDLTHQLSIDEMLKLKTWFYEQFPPSESNESSSGLDSEANYVDSDVSSSFKHQPLHAQEPAPELVLRKLHEVVHNPHEIIADQIRQSAEEHAQRGKDRRSRLEYKKLGEFYKKTATGFIDSGDWRLIADCYARARLGYTAARRYGSARQCAREAGICYTQIADLLERKQDWLEAGRLYALAADHYALAKMMEEVDESRLRTTICYFNVAENARATANLNLAYDYCEKVLAIGAEMQRPSNAVTAARKLIQEIEQLFTKT